MRKDSFINFSLDATFIYDDGMIIGANDKALKLVGAADMNEVANRPINHIFNKDFARRLEKKLEALAQEESIEVYEDILINNDNRVLYVEIGAGPYYFKDKICTAIIIRDNTKQKRLEERLIEAEIIINENMKRFEKLVQLSSDAIFTIENNKIIYANKAAGDFVGVNDYRELLGSEPCTLLKTYPDFAAESSQRMKILKEPEVTVPFMEQKLIRRDGKIINTEVAGTSYLVNGELNYTVVARDITERIKLEENKRKLEQAIEYDRIKTEFFSNLSHELKTPLNIILATIQLVTSIHDEMIPCDQFKRVHKYVKLMKQNCYRLLRLLNNLIDITRLDVGFLKMNFGNHDIISIIEDISVSVAEYTSSKGISLIFDTEIEEKVMACDADKIERVMLNLLSNAVKFTEPGGHIFVNIFDGQDNIIISVKDDGIGIPEDNLDVIFDRFRQVDSLFTRNHEGSGIGLSLVKSLVEEHGGSISVNSVFGEGSEFIVELPVRLMEEDMIAVGKSFVGHEKVERINIEFSDIYS